MTSLRQTLRLLEFGQDFDALGDDIEQQERGHDRQSRCGQQSNGPQKTARKIMARAKSFNIIDWIQIPFRKGRLFRVENLSLPEADTLANPCRFPPLIGQKD